MNVDPNELVATIVDQAHTIRRQHEEIERLTRIALAKDAKLAEVAEEPPAQALEEALRDGE